MNEKPISKSKDVILTNRYLDASEESSDEFKKHDKKLLEREFLLTLTGRRFNANTVDPPMFDFNSCSPKSVTLGIDKWSLPLRNLHSLLLKGSTNPPLVGTVFFGANDAALLGRTSEKQHVPVEEYKENLRRIVHHLKSCSPSMLVVLITPPPIDENGRREYARSIYGEKTMKLPERTNEMTGIYAKQCLKLADELSLPSINLWSKMQGTDGWQTKFLSDGLHLTREGNEIVHREVVRVFNGAGISALDMPFDFPHHTEIDWKNPEKTFLRQ